MNNNNKKKTLNGEMDYLDEALTRLEMLAKPSFLGSQFTLSTQLIQQSCLVIQPSDAAPQFI